MWVALSQAEKQAVERLKSRSDQLESLLEELVSINSHTENHDGVNAVGRAVTGMM